jgi:hypothetical protein
MLNKLSLFSLLLIAFSSSIFGNQVDLSLKQVPLHDRIFMKVFFDESMKRDQAAHVVHFKNKAVCITGSYLKYRGLKFKDVLILKGWIAFKKYERLFPHSNFIFSEYILEGDDDFKALHVYIINKQTLNKCLYSHLPIFETALGPKFSPEMFIAELEKGTSLQSLINGDEMLLGILLGF